MTFWLNCKTWNLCHPLKLAGFEVISGRHAISPFELISIIFATFSTFWRRQSKQNWMKFTAVYYFSVFSAWAGKDTVTWRSASGEGEGWESTCPGLHYRCKLRSANSAVPNFTMSREDLEDPALMYPCSQSEWKGPVSVPIKSHDIVPCKGLLVEFLVIIIHSWSNNLWQCPITVEL